MSGVTQRFRARVQLVTQLLFVKLLFRIFVTVTRVRMGARALLNHWTIIHVHAQQDLEGTTVSKWTTVLLNLVVTVPPASHHRIRTAAHVLKGSLEAHAHVISTSAKKTLVFTAYA